MNTYPTKVHHAGDVSIVSTEAHHDVELSLYKDPVSGLIFGIDQSYLARAQSAHVISPFSGQVVELIGGPYGE